ncbi:hypothetical protein CRG98_018507, partial [Punica granatum]
GDSRADEPIRWAAGWELRSGESEIWRPNFDGEGSRSSPRGDRRARGCSDAEGSDFLRTRGGRTKPDLKRLWRPNFCQFEFRTGGRGSLSEQLPDHINPSSI